MLTSIELGLGIQTLLSIAIAFSLERTYRSTYRCLQKGHQTLSSFQSSYFHVSRIGLSAASLLLLALSSAYFLLRTWDQEGHLNWTWAAAWGALCVTGFVLLICALFDMQVRIISLTQRSLTIGVACLNILSAPLAVFAPLTWWHKIF